MKNTEKALALITSSGGHGFMEVAFSALNRQTPVAFSEKNTPEEFEQEVNDIYNRMHEYCPNMVKASWDERQKYMDEGVSYRQRLLSKKRKEKITRAEIAQFATVKLSPKVDDQTDLPKFTSIKKSGKNIMLIPQKLFSDELCGLSASQQSVPLKVFNFFKKYKHNTYILGQHFHRNNDKEHVERLAEEFNMIVPGQKEDTEVFGLRGVKHSKFINMYKKIDMAVGIAGTHTWNMLTCYPEIPQIIIYNKNGVEKWDEIAKAYRRQGRLVYAIGFDDNTNWDTFAKKLELTYIKVNTLAAKNKAKSKTKTALATFKKANQKN